MTDISTRRPQRRPPQFAEQVARISAESYVDIDDDVLGGAKALAASRRTTVSIGAAV